MSCKCNEVLDIEFELVSKYKDILDESFIPQRADISSLYDLKCAKTTIIPSIYNMHMKFDDSIHKSVECENISRILSKVKNNEPLSLDEMKDYTSYFDLKATLVSTGVKAKYPNNLNAKLYSRSGMPFNCWLIIGNSVGVIDATYYNNPSNEGEIKVMFINLSPFDIVLNKGDKIAQIEFSKFELIKNDNVVNSDRLGGFNSTGFTENK